MPVLINGRSAVHKDSNGKVLTMDVCLTKVGKYTVPIPYMNMAQSQDADQTAAGVFVDGNPACHKDSTFSKSRGDEPGNKKGIRSRKKGAFASFIMGSANVKIEGKPAVRALELMVSNARNTPPSPLMQAVGLPPLPKSAASEAALAPFEGPYIETIVQEGRDDLQTRELIGSLDEPTSQPHHEAFTRVDAGDITFSGLHLPVTPMALVCKEATPWPHKSHDRILIPLGEARHNRIGEEAEYQDIVLQTLTLKRALPPEPETGAEQQEDLREGWLYVYLNGNLWREVQVMPSGYSDIDLHTWHGTDHRPATGTHADHLTIPRLLQGTEVDVQIAFSEVQWSWERISEFGGLSEEDPRRLHRVEEGETLSDIARAYPGTTTEQLVELNDLEDSDAIQEGQTLTLRILPDPPANADEQRQARMGDPVDFAQTEAQEYQWVVPDPLGAVDACNTLISTLLISHQNILSALRGEHLFDTAEDIDNPVPRPFGWMSFKNNKNGELTFPTAPTSRKPGENWREHCEYLTQSAQLAYPLLYEEEGLEEADDKLLKELESARKVTNRVAMETWLQVDERKAHRTRVIELRNSLVDYLSQPETPQEDAFAALEDYATRPAPDYLDLWCRFNEIVGYLTINPLQADQDLELPSRARAELESDTQPGVSLLANIFNGTGEERLQQLHAMLFPAPGTVDPHSDQPADDQLYEQERAHYRTEFDFKRLNDSINTFTSAEGPSHNFGTRLHNAFDNTIKLYLQLERLKPLQSIELDLEVLVRFAKGTRLDFMKDLHIVEAGQDLTGKEVVGRYRVQEQLSVHLGEALGNNQRKQMSGQSGEMNRNGTPATRIMNAEGQVIGSSNLSDLSTYRNQMRPQIDLTDADQIWAYHGKTGNSEQVSRARFRVIALPADIGARLRGRMTEAAKYAERSLPYRALPTALLYFEILQFQSAIEKNKEERGNLSITYATGAIILLVAAIAKAYESLITEDVLLDRLKHSQFAFTRAMSVPVTLKLWGLTLTGPLYRFILGPFTAIIGLLYDVISIRSTLQQGLKGVAAAQAVAALAGFGATLLASKLIVSTVALTIVGLALVAVFVIALVVAFKLMPSYFERSARTSPFSVPNKIMSDDNLATAKQQLSYLIDALLAPRITLQSEERSHEGRDFTLIQLKAEIPAFSSSSVIDVQLKQFGEHDYSIRGGRIHTLIEEHYPPSAEPQSVLRLLNSGSAEYEIYYQIEKVGDLTFRQRASHPTMFHWEAHVTHRMNDEFTVTSGEVNRDRNHPHAIQTKP